MKIVFCDIDGVLNSDYFRSGCDGVAPFVEERKALALKRIIRATGAEVVLTSRANSLFGKTFNRMRVDALRSYGIEPLESMTDIGMDVYKCDGIGSWLSKHPEVTDYVILDDSKVDGLEQFGSRFLLIKKRHGLTAASANKAIAILKGE